MANSILDHEIFSGEELQSFAAKGKKLHIDILVISTNVDKKTHETYQNNKKDQTQE